jgi:hypothetical protein
LDRFVIVGEHGSIRFETASIATMIVAFVKLALAKYLGEASTLICPGTRKSRGDLDQRLKRVQEKAEY